MGMETFSAMDNNGRSIKTLWIGQYSSEEMFQEMVSNGYTDAAGHVSQRNIIEALDTLGMQTDTLNAYNVPAKYTARTVERRVWNRQVGTTDICIGFRNFGYAAHLLRARAMCVEAEQWVRSNRSHNLVVIVYAMQSSALAAALRIKQLARHVHICLIVPDLPQYMDSHMSITKKMLKALDWQVIKRQLPSIDSFVLYTGSMARFLDLPSHKWMIMEGSLAAADIPPAPTFDSHAKNIVMYSGSLDKRLGILELLQAIELLKDENYEFWFTGTGSALLDLLLASKNDVRIKYLGFIPSRAALLQKQQAASMLVNMRSPEEPMSAYSFPSKLLEYMATGRPVLSPRLGGIPSEYYQHLVTMPSIRPVDIASAIRRTASLSESERTRIGAAARNYIVENKTADIQAQRIMHFLSGRLRTDGDHI